MQMSAMKMLLGTLMMAGVVALAGETAFLDTDKVASNYHLSISKNEAFREKQAKAIEEFNRRAKELQAVVDQFKAMQAKELDNTEQQKRAAFLSPIRELQLKGLKLEAELKDFCAAQEAAVKKENSEIKAAIVKDLEAQLAEFAKEKKLEAVVNVSDRDFPYYDKRKDITDEFLAKVNAGHEEYVKKMIEKREAARQAAQEKQTEMPKDAKGAYIMGSGSIPAKADAPK